MARSSPSPTAPTLPPTQSPPSTLGQAPWPPPRTAVHPDLGHPAPSVDAGLDGTRNTANSLRTGHATIAALAGVPLTRITAQTHRDLGVLVNRYIRPSKRLRIPPAKPSACDLEGYGGQWG
jgi:hypothetical protein